MEVYSIGVLAATSVFTISKVRCCSIDEEGEEGEEEEEDEWICVTKKIVRRGEGEEEGEEKEKGKEKERENENEMEHENEKEHDAKKLCKLKVAHIENEEDSGKYSVVLML